MVITETIYGDYKKITAKSVKIVEFMRCGEFTESVRKMQKRKVKHRQCKSCVFGSPEHENCKSYHCYRAGATGETCLKIMPDGRVIDIRGNDPDNCLLYRPGKRKSGDKFRSYKQREGESES